MPIFLKPKYVNEFVLRFGAVDRFLFRISDMYDLDHFIDDGLLRRLDDCHIYLIGKRPRVSLVPGSISIDDHALRFELQYSIGGVPERTTVTVPKQVIPSNEREFEASPYPHRELVSRDEKGEVVAHTVLANYVPFITEMSSIAKDIEVMYVGKGLRKSATDRLENHSSLQRILAGINSNAPDAEVFALVYAFELKKDLYQFLGVSVEITGDIAKNHNANCLKYKPTLEEQTALVEASLISYFRTDEFNTHYLDFPQPHHSILNDVLKADFGAIVVDVDNTPIARQMLYSKHVLPSEFHEVIIKFREG